MQPLAPTSEKQIVIMRIVEYDYVPNRFTVKQGVPVEWRIDADAVGGARSVYY